MLVRERRSPAAKGRPCIVVQRTVTIEHGVKILCVPLTSTLRHIPEHRPVILPSEENGLRVVCEAQVDWLYPFLRENLDSEIGAVDDEAIARVDKALHLWLDL